MSVSAASSTIRCETVGVRLTATRPPRAITSSRTRAEAAWGPPSTSTRQPFSGPDDAAGVLRTTGRAEIGFPGWTTRSSEVNRSSVITVVASSPAREAFLVSRFGSLQTRTLVLVLTLFIGVSPALMPVAYSSARGVRVPPVITNLMPCTRSVPSIHRPTGDHEELTDGARSPYGRRTAAVL